MPIANQIINVNIRPPAPKARVSVGRMNKTESRMAMVLDGLHRAKLIRAWYAQDVTLRIGEQCRYTPDFMVVRNDGGREFIETKGGYIHEDSTVKFKTAAAKFTDSVFTMAQSKKGGAFTVIRLLNGETVLESPRGEAKGTP